MKSNDLEMRGFTTSVIATLGVSTLPGVSWSTLQRLGSPDRVFNLVSGESLAEFTSHINGIGGEFTPENSRIDSWKKFKKYVWHQGMALAEQLCAADVHCLTSASSGYPRQLEDLGPKKPFWLFSKGSQSILKLASVAVVGTRSPSHFGEFLTKYAVACLAELETPVVSGLAIGIDSIAHEWALDTKVPTISVLGSGLLTPYPARNAALADRIVAEGGLLISEYLPRQKPNAGMFVWRNRIQACLATCVVATEWKKSSGTAHTIRFASELSRPTVSINITALPRQPDAGVAHNNFELPQEQVAFRTVVTEAINNFVNGGLHPADNLLHIARLGKIESSEENTAMQISGQGQLFGEGSDVAETRIG